MNIWCDSFLMLLWVFLLLSYCSSCSGVDAAVEQQDTRVSRSGVFSDGWHSEQAKRQQRLENKDVAKWEVMKWRREEETANCKTTEHYLNMANSSLTWIISPLFRAMSSSSTCLLGYQIVFVLCDLNLSFVLSSLMTENYLQSFYLSD